jgi:nucleoside-diphosphate-sugar epimerase
VHVDDAAQETVAVLERGTTGIYNIADDDPAPVSEWLPELARIRGASNAKVIRELHWQRRYRSWREGFRAELVGS